MAVLTYNHLGEDAFITFRYAEQWAAGYGPVFNRGEIVEGTSNPLWLALLMPFAMSGAELHFAARALSVGFLALLVAMGFAMARRRAPGEPMLAWWLALALGFQPFLNYHRDQGLETVQYAAVLGGMVLAAGCRNWLWAAFFGALAGLSRPEGLGFVLALWPVLGAEAWRLRREGTPWRSREMARLAAAWAVPVGVWLAVELARRVYYDAWIPNTVRAKGHDDPPLWLLWRSAGWRQAGALTATWWGFPVLGLAGCAARWLRGRSDVLALAAGLQILAGVAFQLKIGDQLNSGFRYLVPVVVPSLLGLWLGLEWALQRAGGRLGARVAVGLAAGGLLALNLWLPFRWHSPWLRGIANDDPRTRLAVRLGEALRDPAWEERWSWYRSDPILINAQAGRWLSENLLPEHPGAMLAADQMGMLGYYLPRETHIVDMLGLMDRHVATFNLSGPPLADYLLSRGVDFIVLYAWQDEPLEGWIEPGDEGRAVVWPLRPTVEAPPGSDRYTLWYRLQSEVDGIQFLVYGPKDGAPQAAPESVFVGPGAADFLRAWRVTPPWEVPPPPK